jgi:tripartite-type tricarboxylate transporter receptor subunit TctC
VGSTTFLAMEILKGMAGANILHVPYRGGAEAVTAVLSGETSVAFLPISTALSQVKSGRLLAIAVSTAQRLPNHPGIPTAAESGIAGYEFNNWYGLLVPAKSPKEAVDAINAAAAAVLKHPDAGRRLIEMGFVPVVNRPEEFGAYIKSEIDRLGKLIRAFKLAVD